MKRRSWFDTIILVLNFLAAVLSFVSYIAPITGNQNGSFLSFLGLGIPLMVVVHLIFLGYWLLRRRWYAAISLLVVLIGYMSLDSFYRFGSSEEAMPNDLKVMSYNVRCFNRYEELPSKTVLEDILAFVEKEDPDIICIQEPYYDSGQYFTDYRYRYLEYFHMIGKGLLAVFSKYPIVETGMLNLPQTESNAIYADIRYKNDTLRVYNVHLESLGITPGRVELSKEPTDKLFHQVSAAFRKQMEQAVVIKHHMGDSPHRSILCGDFNNGQYSNVYRTIKGEFQDTFLEAGTGYGRTFNFHGIPLRIDFILSDPYFTVKSHMNYDVRYSDHFPVMASFHW